MDNFGNWLNDELNKRDWSQRELARRAGLSNTAVGNVVTGYRPPTWDFCAAVAKPLERTPLEIFQMAGLLPGGPHRIEERRGEYYAQTMTEDEAALLEDVRRLSDYDRGLVADLARMLLARSAG